MKIPWRSQHTGRRQCFGRDTDIQGYARLLVMIIDSVHLTVIAVLIPGYYTSATAVAVMRNIKVIVFETSLL